MVANGNYKIEFKDKDSQIGLIDDDGFVSGEEFIGSTNLEGYFEKFLWCDEDSHVEIDYVIYLPRVSNGNFDLKLKAEFSLSYGDGSAIGLGKVIAAGENITPSNPLYVYVVSEIAAKAVRFDAEQTLTTAQKQQAQANLGLDGGGGTPAGADTQIQFNLNGEFGAATSFVWQNSRLGVGTNAPIAKAHIKTNVADDRVLVVDGAENHTAALISAGKNGNPNFFIVNGNGEIAALNGNTARISSAQGKPFFPDGLITLQLQSFTNTPATLIMNENSGTEFIFQSNYASSTPIAARAAVAQTADVFRGLKSDGTDAFVLDKNCTPGVKVNAAPADADIDANQLFYWFDSNNAAPKVMFKAKRADGTVVSAEINLT